MLTLNRSSLEYPEKFVWLRGEDYLTKYFAKDIFCTFCLLFMCIYFRERLGSNICFDSVSSIEIASRNLLGCSKKVRIHWNKGYSLAVRVNRRLPVSLNVLALLQIKRKISRNLARFCINNFWGSRHFKAWMLSIWVHWMICLIRMYFKSAPGKFIEEKEVLESTPKRTAFFEHVAE